MSQQQKAEKITHLQNQLQSPKMFEFPIQNSLAIQRFYNRAINRYRA